MAGLFITMEGCDGAGKSLQCRLLHEYLVKEGVNALLTRDPGGTAYSEKIRSLILGPENHMISPITEALLYAACRAQLVSEVIAPALYAGTTVICDRFVDSSVAYQGYARGLGEKLIRDINTGAVQGLEPDITFFIDLPPHLSLGRKRSNMPLDRIELEKNDFHDKVYEGYKTLAKENPNRIAVMNGTLDADVIHRNIIHTLRPLLYLIPRGL